MKRKIHISNQSINMTNNASFRFCVYKSHQLFRTCIGVLCIPPVIPSNELFHCIPNQSMTNSLSNSSSFFANPSSGTCPHFRKRIILCTQCHLRSATLPNVSPSDKLLIKYRFSLSSPRPSVSDIVA